MRPFDSVILNEDLPEYHLKAGTQGAIVDAHEHHPDIFGVEFFGEAGQTLDVVFVRADQITVTLSDFAAGESIALLSDLPAQRLARGQVGIIRQRIAPGVYTVAFADAHGIPYAQVTLHAGQMLLLQWRPAPAQQSA